MANFTLENTHGYTQEQLDELNRRLEKTILDTLRHPGDTLHADTMERFAETMSLRKNFKTAVQPSNILFGKVKIEIIPHNGEYNNEGVRFETAIVRGADFDSELS